MLWIRVIWNAGLLRGTGGKYVEKGRYSPDWGVALTGFPVGKAHPTGLNGSLDRWGRPGDWSKEADQIYELRVR